MKNNVVIIAVTVVVVVMMCIGGCLCGLSMLGDEPESGSGQSLGGSTGQPSNNAGGSGKSSSDDDGADYYGDDDYSYDDADDGDYSYDDEDDYGEDYSDDDYYSDDSYAADDEPEYENNGRVIELNDRNFTKLCMDFNGENYVCPVPCIIDCGATWCTYCQQMEPILERIQRKYGNKLQVFKVDVDESPKITELFEAQSLPTILFLDRTGDGCISEGFLEESDVEDAISEYCKPSSSRRSKSLKIGPKSWKDKSISQHADKSSKIK